MQRQSAQFVGSKWNQINTEVFDGEGNRIGRFVDNATAEYVARLHNIFPTIANIVIRLISKRSEHA